MKSIALALAVLLATSSVVLADNATEAQSEELAPAEGILEISTAEELALPSEADSNLTDEEAAN